MKAITRQLLKEKRACASALDLFKAHFGDSVEVTEARCVHYAGRFNFGWAVMRLLPPQVEAEIWIRLDMELAPQRKRYQKALDKAKNFGDLADVQQDLSDARAILLARYFAQAWAELPEDYAP